LDPWARVVEEQIQEAIERGVFDHLSGKGQALNLGGNPFEEPLAGTMRRLLRDNGSSHPLIEARRALESEVDECRIELRRAWSSHRRYPSEPAWEHACARFRQRIREINRQIKLNNLKAPLPNFHMRVVDAEADISAVQLR
jgi:DnaJ family protein C protein 28